MALLDKFYGKRNVRVFTVSRNGMYHDVVSRYSAVASLRDQPCVFLA